MDIASQFQQLSEGTRSQGQVLRRCVRSTLYRCCFDLKLVIGMWTNATDLAAGLHPDLKLAFANLDRSNPSPHTGEEDAFGDDMVMPEALTQAGVGSPGNTSTGTICLCRHID